MKNSITALCAALTGAILAGPALAAGVEGVWQTEPNDDGKYLHVRVGPCQDNPEHVCGTIDSAHGGANEANVGKPIIWDMVPDGENEWDDGTIWKVDDDEEYDSEMELKGDVLEVSGCVLGGLICRSQDWKRVE